MLPERACYLSISARALHFLGIDDSYCAPRLNSRQEHNTAQNHTHTQAHTTHLQAHTTHFHTKPNHKEHRTQHKPHTHTNHISLPPWLWRLVLDHQSPSYRSPPHRVQPPTTRLRGPKDVRLHCCCKPSLDLHHLTERFAMSAPGAVDGERIRLASSTSTQSTARRPTSPDHPHQARDSESTNVPHKGPSAIPTLYHRNQAGETTEDTDTILLEETCHDQNEDTGLFTCLCPTRYCEYPEHLPTPNQRFDSCTNTPYETMPSHAPFSPLLEFRIKLYHHPCQASGIARDLHVPTSCLTHHTSVILA